MVAFKAADDELSISFEPFRWEVRRCSSTARPEECRRKKGCARPPDYLDSANWQSCPNIRGSYPLAKHHQSTWKMCGSPGTRVHARNAFPLEPEARDKSSWQSVARPRRIQRTMGRALGAAFSEFANRAADCWISDELRSRGPRPGYISLLSKKKRNAESETQRASKKHKQFIYFQ